MKLIVTGELTDLNTYVNKERGNRFAAAAIKAKETNRIYWECKTQKIPKVLPPVLLECQWFCKNQRKDKDNISFGKKFILDGVVKAGVLPNDKWDMVVGFIDSFYVDKINPRIEVYLHEVEKEKGQIPRSLR